MKTLSETQVLFCLSLSSLLSPVTLAQPGFCYGLQQSNPADHITSPALSFSENDSLYVYTSPLQNSTCLNGTLIEFNFCYKPTCSARSGPVLYILVLLDMGLNYVVNYIHEEMEDRGYCDQGRQVPSNCCCKRIAVNNSLPIVVDENYALGFIVPNDTEGEYLYETEGMSLGFISNPPPSLPVEGEVLDVVREKPQLIPDRLFRIVLDHKIADTTTDSNDIINFIMGNVLLVVSFGEIILVLLVSCIALAFMIGLKVKHNKLRKRLRRHGVRREKNSGTAGVPNALPIETVGVADQYEDMERADLEGYIHMVSSPVRKQSFNLLRSGSLLRREEYRTDNDVSPSIYRREYLGEEYLNPAKDENSLYAQCNMLNLKHITRSSLILGEKLGSGQFGTVVKGEWTKDTSEGDGDMFKSAEDLDREEERVVAVKTLKEGSNLNNTIKFLREAAIMGQFNHPNVVKLYGVVTEGEPKMLVLELLSGGDLNKVLVSLHQSSSNEPVQSDVPHTLLSYCRQVASGMTYLSNKAFVHRDLAARNILVSEDGTCKIADFGMARDLIDETYYVTEGGRIPVKWTAPEALHYKKYSTASDAWSFGAVMYEIWSLGHTPFEDYSNAKTIEMVEKGIRIPPSPGCPKAIYSLMIKCWHSSPSKRPSFPKILQQLSLPDTKILRPEPPPTESQDPEQTAPSLGDDLATSAHLFKELQETYLQCTSVLS